MRALLAVFALSLGLSGLPAHAEDAAPPASATSPFYGDLVQVPLTEADIQHYIAAMPDMQQAMGDAPADAAEPDAKTMVKLEAVAKAHGFKDFSQYNTIAGNIALVLDGVDPETKTFVGPEKLIDRSAAQVKADAKLSDAEKKAALADLATQRQSVIDVKFKDNIDLVVKNYDKLQEN